MNKIKGYIYVRNHPSYDVENSCKLGKTENIPDRDTQYATGEIRRGWFEPVFELYFSTHIVEKILQNEFSNLNIKFNGGTEFYDKQIINMIEPFFQKNKIQYKKLCNQEIDLLIRKNRLKKIFKKVNKKLLINSLINSFKNNEKNISPRPDQCEIINKSIEHFDKNDKGMLILMCGYGKTLISLWITQKLNSQKIIIGVPNILLLNQWKESIGILFKNIPCLTILGGVDVDDIIHFLRINNRKCILITTYSSSHKVFNATNQINFVFDMKINDEVHHLTSNNFNDNENKTFVNMLKVNSVKQISLTATLKLLENNDKNRRDDIIVSNDNIDYFGEIIDEKNLLDAISKNIICDYVIQTIITDEKNLNVLLLEIQIEEINDKRLFLSAYASLKSIFEEHSHHILIYSNNTNNSLKLIEYIKLILDKKYFDIPNLYYSNYDSLMNNRDQKEILKNFEKSNFGIITCVYCLGEGWDFPLLDAVVFSENMSSNIRIVQSALRASRKNKLQPYKITKIIIPILNKNDWLENNENPDFKKVREIIFQMGSEDVKISQKIKVSFIDVKKTNSKPKKIINNHLGIYNEELTKSLILKTNKRTSIGITYEKARKIIAEKNIKTKEDYYELCNNDNRLEKEPEIIFKGKFTNWIEYLSIERIYYDLETCKKKVNEYLLLYPEIKKNYLELLIVSNELCKIDQLFPPNGLWVEYYNLKDLRDIITITNKKKKTSGAK
jgi:superfamily II DNA or RNA helicase